MIDFDEYIRLGEPDKKEKCTIWQAAIGLQDTDGLKPSKYLIENAKLNIEGKISFYEVRERINNYYIEKPAKDKNDRTEEADKVSAAIAEILSEKAFSFRPAEYISIHKRLFTGIYKFAGKIRDYNISKKEWVLAGESVFYASSDNIQATLDYDFLQEKNFSYKGLSKEETAEHIARFISGLWQIHAFGEGNTRTTAVFAIKYLRTFGFNVENVLFSENSWYFRNALVRANYSNHEKGIYSTMEYLTRFFANLLFNENYPLKNRIMHINYGKNDTVNTGIDTVNENYDTVNTGIDTVNTNFDTVNEKNDTVFNLIKEDINITSAQIAEKTGLSIATVKRRIKELKDSNKIERIGSDKKGHWEILG